MDNDAFDGAKAAVFIGERLLVYQRDRRADLRWSGMWDFPGGGREGPESPTQTLARELDEEFGLDLAAGKELWRHEQAAGFDPALRVWFFVLQFPQAARNSLRFGAEGQRWDLWPVRRVLASAEVIPSLRQRLALWQTRFESQRLD